MMLLHNGTKGVSQFELRKQTGVFFLPPLDQIQYGSCPRHSHREYVYQKATHNKIAKIEQNDRNRCARINMLRIL